MADNGFLKDLRTGKIAELRVGEILREKYNAEAVFHNNRGKAYDFELRLSSGETRSYEVKTDEMSKRTRNLFFEYRCAGKDSGLSSTISDYYAVLIPHLNEILLFKPKIMLGYLQQSKHRNLKGGDRNAVSGYVVKIDVIKALDFVEVIPA